MMRNIWAILALGLFCVASFGQTSQPTRLPVPDDKALQQAATEVQDVFGKDIASAKTCDERTALAKQMLTAAKTGSAANAFQLLETAASLLASPDSSKPPKRNVPLFLDAIDQWIAAFEVPSASLAAALQKATTVLAEDDAKSFYERMRPWLDGALGQDDYERANALTPIMARVARFTKVAGNIQEADQLKADMQAAQGVFRSSRAAAEALKTAPDNPEAAYKVGVYLAYYKGDWDAGLPLLSKAASETVKTAARMDLAKPTEAKSQLELADMWWAVAENERVSLAQVNIRSHAGTWYAEAVPSLTGLDKVKAEKRRAEAERNRAIGGSDRSKPFQNGTWTITWNKGVITDHMKIVDGAITEYRANITRGNIQYPVTAIPNPPPGFVVFQNVWGIIVIKKQTGEAVYFKSKQDMEANRPDNTGTATFEASPGTVGHKATELGSFNNGVWTINWDNGDVDHVRVLKNTVMEWTSDRGQKVDATTTPSPPGVLVYHSRSRMAVCFVIKTHTGEALIFNSKTDMEANRPIQKGTATFKAGAEAKTK
jgi:cell division septum initiation protein DivIVA